MNDDDPMAADVEAAWAAEIDRRAAEARQNPDDGLDWRVVREEIERDVLSR
jgi:hypothetical protein